VSLITGIATSGRGGAISISVGSGSSSTGGNVVVKAGTMSGATQAGGSISITVGSFNSAGSGFVSIGGPMTFSTTTVTLTGTTQGLSLQFSYVLLRSTTTADLATLGVGTHGQVISLIMYQEATTAGVISVTFTGTTGATRTATFDEASQPNQDGVTLQYCGTCASAGWTVISATAVIS
jgi:hypothetical protein